MGPDGHTASLFPYSQALTERKRWVVGHHVARLGKARITMTPPILNRAAEVRLLVTGTDKAGVLREALLGPREPERLPVQLVAPEAGRLVWMLDRAAAAELARRPPRSDRTLGGASLYLTHMHLDMQQALRRHWPEYLMEGAHLGLFMLVGLRLRHVMLLSSGSSLSRDLGRRESETLR